MAAKNPMKLARKELLKCGATILNEGDYETLYQLPQGSRFVVSKKTSLRKVREVIAASRAKANALNRNFRETVRVNVEGNTVVATQHFHKRFDQMRRQDDVTRAEVVEALLEPARVFQDSESGKYAFCGDRVSVVVDVEDEVVSLITLMWASEELWEKNPRPEEVSNV